MKIADDAAVGRPIHRNVLLVLIDDLRDVRHSPSLTPSLIALASESLSFTRHYSALSSCAPARTALLTGRRPDATRTWDLHTYWRDEGTTKIPSLPQFLRAHGYRTIGIGKVFHPNHASGLLNASQPGGPREDQDGLFSWSEPFWRVPEATLLALERAVNRTSWLSVPSSMGLTLPDELIADRAVHELHRLERRAGEPFFLAVGFVRPHLPLVAPASSFAAASAAMANAALHAPTPLPPRGMPRMAWHGSGELTNHLDVAAAAGTPIGRPLSPTGPRIAPHTSHALRLAYAAAAHHVDEQLGKVLGSLRRSSFGNQTVTVLTSDHGFGLGERGLWGKHTNFDVALRVPLLLHAPMLQLPGAHHAAAYTEHVDIFPTVVMLATGERLEQCSRGSSSMTPNVCVDGVALVEPATHGGLRMRSTPRAIAAAFSQHPASPAGRAKPSPCLSPSGCTMGYSVATQLEDGHGYRLTLWVRFQTAPDWERVLASELYNYSESDQAPSAGTEVADGVLGSMASAEVFNRHGEHAYSRVERRLTGMLRRGIG